jgi:death-on-curing family protein
MNNAVIFIEEVQYIAHDMAKRKLGFNEPIPDFSTRFPNILESCIATPFQTYARKELYPKLIDKASILFYLMIKNHPFQNGNKRVAVTTLLVFLSKNNKWLDVGVKRLYYFAVDVAESPAEKKNKTIKYISSFIETFMVEY